MTFVVVLSLALLIGVGVAVLGGGGSILTVPLLVYVAGIDPKAAIAASLLVVGVTSATGAVSHACAGRVEWWTALIFGGAGMVGAYGGGRAAAFVPGSVLLVGFGVMMALTAVAMLRGRRRPVAADHGGRRALPRIAVDGVVVGAVTGLVGAGGGFLVVPALVLLGGLPMASAVGTSLVVVALKSGAGLLGYLASTPLDWNLTLAVTASAVVGSVVGGMVAGRIPQEVLRRVFGWSVLVMAAVVLGQELPRATSLAPFEGPTAWIALVGVTIGVTLVMMARRRRAARTVVGPRIRTESASHHDTRAPITDTIARPAPSSGDGRARATSMGRTRDGERRDDRDPVPR